jgi:hypothetical protein
MPRGVADARRHGAAEPGSPDAPNDLFVPACVDNYLFGPAGVDNVVEGQFASTEFKRSMSTWLDLHLVVKTGAMLGVAVGLGALLGRGSDAKTALGAGTRHAQVAERNRVPAAYFMTSACIPICPRRNPETPTPLMIEALQPMYVWAFIACLMAAVIVRDLTW